MRLNGLHLLLTYQCTYECDHCFVWGSPFQSGVMTLDQTLSILDQGLELGTVEWVYFEGGEPFLYYPVLVKAVQEANRRGFKVGLVSNAYWATSLEDAHLWLNPFKGFVNDLSVSSDVFHTSDRMKYLALNAQQAAGDLGIPYDVLRVAAPATSMDEVVEGSTLMYRGRATQKLAKEADHLDWRQFDSCPYENLTDPGRVHIDPLGNIHICQGILMGNVFEARLADIIGSYHPENHPILGPIISGGPVELVHKYDLSHAETYADACHFCYQARQSLRTRYSDVLGPDQVYGIYSAS
jgi:organic radical activating enzyme